MTASPSYIDRPDYTDPRNPARFDLPLAARSILSSYVVAQAWLDRIGGALSVQCHPSAVRDEESYTSNAGLGATTEMWRAQCVGSWLIEPDGQNAVTLPIAGVCSEGPETQPTAAAVMSTLVYYNLDTAADTLPAERSIVHSDGTNTTTATPDAPVSVGQYRTADQVSADTLIPAQYLGILVGSGCFNTSSADLTSQSYATALARGLNRSAGWIYGGAVASGNDYDPRTITVDALIPAGSGDGTGIAYVATCATSVGRR